jgi:hypothetical protein
MMRTDRDDPFEGKPTRPCCRIAALCPEFRLALTRDGYALVKCKFAVFRLEA